jgi:hypothetical protein
MAPFLPQRDERETERERERERVGRGEIRAAMLTQYANTHFHIIYKKDGAPIPGINRVA